MKLVEILARELKEWPSSTDVVGQSSDGSLHLNAASVSNKGFTDQRFSMAEDWLKSDVTRAEWEAERARIAKPASKANKDGWIRHRGGKCPVEAGVLVEVRYRAEIDDSQPVEGIQMRWDHIKTGGDIMAYRIHEIDRTLEALEEERVSLIQRLESEGLQLLQAKACGSVQPVEDMSDPESWKVGDKLKAIGACGGFSFKGEIVTVLNILDDGGLEVATADEPDYGWFFASHEVETDLEFHSRPLT